MLLQKYNLSLSNLKTNIIDLYLCLALCDTSEVKSDVTATLNKY